MLATTFAPTQAHDKMNEKSLGWGVLFFGQRLKFGSGSGGYELCSIKQFVGGSAGNHRRCGSWWEGCRSLEIFRSRRNSRSHFRNTCLSLLHQTQLAMR